MQPKHWLTLANDGDCAAMFEVGKCCDWGEGTETNRSEALAWYKKAAAEGHLYAQEVLEEM